jgi:leucyl/phenylalanyl-tRNA--protein transferase
MVFVLDDNTDFPPASMAEPDGLLAIGGDLAPERLLKAYPSGIFPWYEGEHILWWSPDPRFVLFPEEFKKSKTVSKLEAKGEFTFTINQAFREVIHHCRSVKRPGQDGTWITEAVERSFLELHKMGYAHSAEAWQGERLVGGLYGIRMGRVFFGESMFSLEPHASRFAFTKFVDHLKSEAVILIDCQVYTPYLESFGARMIAREEFLRLLGEAVSNGQ